ncbi:hypothetical protein H2199_004691 [Coniosporium tulheliwenetii]|uniref:Uncharacterized protein n=1 Tax=Coniosporium tulheliwenetii TaxID=3383036 RepID=A0ACC2Z3T2_9PEZI|nr:hypothetical protein H2199_004691 [Cladosporium sp. JES 115]
MGLPVWRAPSPADSTKAADKADPTASARSPIRRHSPRIRPGRSRDVRQRARVEYFDSFRSAERIRPPHAGAFQPYAVEEDASSSEGPGQNTNLPPVPESMNYSRSEDEASRPATASRQHDERARFPVPRALNPFARPSTRPRDNPSAMIRPQHSYSYRPRELPAYTPNFAPARRASLRASDSLQHPSNSSYYPGPLENHLDPSGHLPDFPSPAHGPAHRRRRPLPSSSLRESWSPATTVNGLGDRERSFSPGDDNLADNWDAMHSTVAPDPLEPSADSSFTSAAASASFSATTRHSNNSSRSSRRSGSGSASSARTHITVPSDVERYAWTVTQVCDTSEDGGSETEADEGEAGISPRSRNPMRQVLLEERRMRRRLEVAEQAVLERPPRREPVRYSAGTRERSEEAGEAVRGYYGRGGEYALMETRTQLDELESREERSREIEAEVHQVALREELRSQLAERRRLEEERRALEEENEQLQPQQPLTQTFDPELEEMRSLLERIARRDDIPEEWWMSVGLVPSLPRRVIERLARERL